jgi:hypothetical protein
MICEFCGGEYPEGTIICRTCNDYKGLITPEEKRTLGMVSLDQALNDAMAIMDEARDYHLDNPCNEGDCELCNEEN